MRPLRYEGHSTVVENVVHECSNYEDDPHPEFHWSCCRAGVMWDCPSNVTNDDDDLMYVQIEHSCNASLGNGTWYTSPPSRNLTRRTRLVLASVVVGGQDATDTTRRGVRLCATL